MIQPDNHPLTNSKRIGLQMGTKLKKKIFKALKNWQPTVKTFINNFNQSYTLMYNEFVIFPLDHQFWNDDLSYHFKAPWAIDSDVQEIPATLNLNQVQKEFQILAQELTETFCKLNSCTLFLLVCSF
ncbi:hypothetical protein VP01_4197g1 [Puccinia sorghi]|uniref:Uncharacterized protein n=1 Tax=Puccinia sorghi TaxID=27349 RepID=A0A0L6USS6_9BASI|nr:hypothetical protein VP01_4197g1 [Puccinia sorghi]